MAEPASDQEHYKKTFKDIIMENKRASLLGLIIIIVLSYEYLERLYTWIVNKIINRNIYFHVDKLPTGPRSLKDRWRQLKIYYFLGAMIIKYIIKIYNKLYVSEDNEED
tara:strand:+ start:1122 stop:1448 length:327 start_codon:yes stop_codon:yes gene_type:complete